MKKIFHILKGWSRSYIYSSAKIKQLSEERLKVCRDCPFAVEKTFLKILRDDAVEEKKKACKFCGCPIVEKSLVEESCCELNLWNR